MNIVLEMPDGSRREVPEGPEFRLRPGEKVIGSTRNIEQDGMVAEVVKQTGLPLGDIIAAVAKFAGFQHCLSCEKSRKVFNRISELGVAETVRQVREIKKGKT